MYGAFFCHELQGFSRIGVLLVTCYVLNSCQFVQMKWHEPRACTL